MCPLLSIVSSPSVERFADKDSAKTKKSAYANNSKIFEYKLTTDLASCAELYVFLLITMMFYFIHLDQIREKSYLRQTKMDNVIKLSIVSLQWLKDL